MSISARKIYVGITRLGLFLKKLQTKPAHLVIPVFFSLLASLCEAATIAALTPFMNGFLNQDFVFIESSSLLQYAMELLPNTYQDKNGTIIFIFIFFIVLMVILKSLMSYVSCVSLAWQARKMNDHLRRALIDRYLIFGKSYYDKTGAGQQLQVLMTHPARILQTLVTLNGSFSAVFLLAVYFVSIWIISWQLTLMVIAISPLVFVSQHWLIAKIKASSSTDSITRADLNQKTVNILTGIPFIQSQCAEAREREVYARLSHRQMQTEYSIDKKRYFVTPVNEFVGMVVMVVILCAMSFLMFRQHVGSAAQYMVYFYILRRIMANAQIFNQLRAEVAGVAAPIRDVLDVLDDVGKPFVTHGTSEFNGLSASIEIRDLNYAYDAGRLILDRVSMTLPKGGMTAIVGPSGSGKSTVIQLLLRFYDCSPGSILIDGKDIRDYSVQSLRERTAWVSQETHLFNDTLRANIVFGLNREIEDAEMAEVLRRARLQKFVEKLPKGLETLIGDRGVNLSGGEKQRVSIARAILKKSQILLLDEATSALDTVTESEIQEALGDLIAGQTAIVVAHRLSTIRHADRVIYMENGRVHEEGSLQELLDLKGKFYASWQAQRFF